MEVIRDILAVADVAEHLVGHADIGALAETCRPLPAINANNPTVLMATVFPPVLGPVITIPGPAANRKSAGRMFQPESWDGALRQALCAHPC